ncbi:MAG: VPLPA-CTERM sorting domain-containing protein [Gammaproteobacteria bacterium]|nr:VPLPA-CTERM sorting domain-containing protein [Gammaproteobacteria bacterium]
MQRSLKLLGAAAALALAPVSQAAVTLTEYGTLATVSSFNCDSDVCGESLFELLTLVVDPIDGGVQQTEASVASGTWGDPGSVLASAAVAGGLAVPQLKAGAFGDASTWYAGQSLAIQAYEYTGAGETLSLDWNLTGNVTNPDGDTVTGLVILAGFFTSDQLTQFPALTGTFTDADLLFDLALASPDDNFLEFTTPGAVNETGTISIDVVTGDQIYLVMGLMAGAGGTGAAAESLNTLTASFNGTPALTPAITAVPVPAAVWLFGSAFGGLVVSRRRRQS